MTGRDVWSLVAPILVAVGKPEEANSYFTLDAYVTVYAALRWWDESKEYRESLMKEEQDAPQNRDNTDSNLRTLL